MHDSRWPLEKCLTTADLKKEEKKEGGGVSLQLDSDRCSSSGGDGHSWKHREEGFSSCSSITLRNVKNLNITLKTANGNTKTLKTLSNVTKKKITSHY